MPVETLGELLRETARRYPDCEAVTYRSQRYSYAELDCATDDLAKAMYRFGIRRGQHAAVLTNNKPEGLACYYALWKLGAVVIPLCTACSAAELEECLRIVDAEYLFFDDGFKDTQFLPMAAAQKIVPPERMIALTEENDVCKNLEQLLQLRGGISDAQLEEIKAAVEPEDMDCMLFTSGSTGSSRPVMTTHRSRTLNAYAQSEALKTTCADRFCAVLPMYHCFALSGTILAALVAGACVCFPDSRRTADIMSVIENEKCTVFSAVPTLYLAVMARPDLKDRDLSSLRTAMIGGSSYPPELFIRVCRELGMTLLPSLGQTEATAGITGGSLDDPLALRAETIGRFFPNVEGKIVDLNDGGECPAGSIGELCVRGPFVMKGYYRMPEQTAKVLDADGWLHTGDLASIDGQGIITYRGRLKELIIRGGENISPVEIETVLAGHPAVASVKAVSVSDAHYMEEICACVVLEKGARTGEAELRAFCAERLAYYKVPKYFLYLNHLPLKASGKVDVAALRSMAEKALNN